jgi:hypothetical protein
MSCAVIGAAPRDIAIAQQLCVMRSPTIACHCGYTITHWEFLGSADVRAMRSSEQGLLLWRAHSQHFADEGIDIAELSAVIDEGRADRELAADRRC